MNNDELLKFRSRYNKEIKNNDKAISKKQEVLELLENPDVKRFLSLKKYIDYKEKSISEIIKDSFSSIKIDTKNSNNILVYVGTYNEKDKFVKDVKIKKGYKTYLDLETIDSIHVDLSEVSEFEKGNDIIYISDCRDSSSQYMDDFFRLREYFFERLVSCSQEEVIEEFKCGKVIKKVFEK